MKLFLFIFYFIVIVRVVYGHEILDCLEKISIENDVINNEFENSGSFNYYKMKMLVNEYNQIIDKYSVKEWILANIMNMTLFNNNTLHVKAIIKKMQSRHKKLIKIANREEL